MVSAEIIAGAIAASATVSRYSMEPAPGISRNPLLWANSPAAPAITE